MATDRQIQLFEFTAVHGCSQEVAGNMIDPPISQTTVNRELKSLFTTHPELHAVKNYLQSNSDFAPKSDPSGMLSYDEGMDSQVIARF